jgi:CDP-6-deoxy-D-xylo-4-hexulose-3-dehydrase
MTTIEGGMVTTNDDDLYELMRMKRSHGLARESGNLSKYTSKYPDIHPQFLFATDGYNFRSTEINAILGMQQLPRLNGFIDTRKKNFSIFVDLLDEYKDLFYPLVDQKGNSNYAFPFVCKNPNIKHKLMQLFDANKIENRPIVSGNLLKQPFLKGYDFAIKSKSYNADVLNDNGLYIGNSQFINPNQIYKLFELIAKEFKK